MAKLASARDFRAYGPPRVRNRWEYINAAVYIFAAVLLAGGFAAQHSSAGDAKSGIVVLLIAIFLLAAVNIHDLVAHLAGIDFSLLLLEFDAQIAFVEIAVPLFVLVGDVLSAVGFVFLLIQKERGYNWRLEKHATNLLIAGPVFWLLGSIQNLCQVYERSNGHIQILQKSVQIPFLLGSLLFLVGGVFNMHEIFGHHSFRLVGKSWVWLSLFGSLFFLIGGLMNVVKVFKMQQMDGGRLEKLRGGALERLIGEREGRVPLILEGSGRHQPDKSSTHVPISGRAGEGTATPYKDVLVGGGGHEG
ncbi:hypothetical protein KSP40_PGU011618 [Platanthera guangdongensis]|uniref:Uncharacterized protein n=1 Tax=Platanthera guangdongensis TaxID=2320717 RepID=A0ABR2N133_9ASPA